MQISPIPMEDLTELLSLQMESGGVARLVVTGSSMYPTLRHRKDTVFLKPISKPLNRGDLILYRRNNGQYVLHRIVSKPKNGAFICCGDNQWQKEPVTESQVIAVTDGFVRKGKSYGEDHFGYRAWVWVWLLLFPFRRPILALRRVCGRLRKQIH